MRLHSPVLGLLGLLALGAVAVQLLDGSLDVQAAASRIAVVLAVLLVVERVVLPLARALVGRPAPPPDPDAPEADRPRP